jgi:8-hydroxy-5-deazaflavin:NADPH oxidoreductase
MRFGILGTGVVGQTVGTKLVELGHEVKMGSRQAGNEKAVTWAGEAGAGASEGTFADAAAFGETLVNATGGLVSLDALAAAGAENLAGKVLIDISNPLDFSGGFPPSLGVSNTDSTGEQIQRAYPEARVVKALNTISASVMVDPGSLPGTHHLFICGDDDTAKTEVKQLLTTFGWPDESFVDLGDITNARGTEGYLALWIRLYGVLGTPHFNVGIHKPS